MPRPGPTYTEQDDAFLQQNYRRRGAKWCAEKLGRSADGVGCRAKRLGLARKREEIARPSTDLIDAVIRRYYTGARPWGFVQDCARQVGKEAHWVSRRAVDLGLVQARDQRPWTQAELDFVSARPLIALRDLSRRMARKGWHRTPAALAYIRKTGQVETIDSAQFTAAGLAEAMGTTTTTVMGWVKRDLLKAGRRGWDRSEAQRGDGYIIHEADVAAFVMQYPAHISLAKLEPNKFWFLDLLARYARSVGATGRQAMKVAA